MIDLWLCMNKTSTYLFLMIQVWNNMRLNKWHDWQYAYSGWMSRSLHAESTTSLWQTHMFADCHAECDSAHGHCSDSYHCAHIWWENSVWQTQVLLHSPRIFFLTITSKLGKPGGNIETNLNRIYSSEFLIWNDIWFTRRGEKEDKVDKKKAKPDSLHNDSEWMNIQGSESLTSPPV